MKNYARQPFVRQFAALAAIAICLPLRAGGETNNGGAWTWEQCLAAAQDQMPPELVAARCASESARSRMAAANAAFRPQIALNGGAGLVEDTREDESGAAWGYLASVTAELPLYPSRTLNGTRQLREADARAAGVSGARIQADYLWRVRMAFVDLLGAQENLQWTEEIQKRRQALFQAVEARHLAGQEQAGNVAVGRSALAEADNETIQATRTLALCRDELNSLLGFDSGRIVRASGPLGCEPPPACPADFKARVEETPEYAAAQMAVQQAAARAAVAKGQNSYQLDAVARASPRSDSWVQQDPEWFVGVRLTLPLYEGGRTRQEYKAAQSDVRKAEAQMQALQRDLRMEFQTAWADYQAKADRQALQKDVIESASLRADIAQREYETGLTPLVPWEAAENDWANKGRTAIQIRRAAAVAQARWERLLDAAPLDGAEKKGTTK